LRHRTEQIAMDGTQKLPQRLFGVIAARRAAGTTPHHALLAVAAWMRYVSAQRDERGRQLAVDDPLADVLRRRLAGAESPADVVDRLLGLEQLFPEQLRDDAVVRAELTDDVGQLAGDGVLATLRELC
jgi:fructuronate reductase